MAAPNTLARSKIIPQFSGPFKPRPPLTTISASVNGTSPLTLFTAVIFTLGSSIETATATTSATPSPMVVWKLFGFKEITLIGEVIFIWANALPLKTVFFTVKPLVVSGNAIAPATNPAFNLADTRPAMALPVWLWAITITVAPMLVAVSAITFA